MPRTLSRLLLVVKDATPLNNSTADKASIEFTANTNTVRASVVDPHHFDLDPDSTYHPDADPDPEIWFLFDADVDADPDSTFHPDADPDPDPDPSFQIKAQTLEKVLN